MKPVAALWRLGISLAVTGVLFLLIANALSNPVDVKTRTYTAEFSDVSGLHNDADVRVRGVRVGKIEAIELTRHAGKNVAAVRFTLSSRYGVVPSTRLAVKFQALTGARYMDVTNAAEGYKAVDLVTKIPTSMTQPSFDVTALFNGLQPVFATMSPEEINTLTANVASFLSGDDNGLAPMLESVRKLTRLVSDRQEVVSTLMNNLTEVGTAIDGGTEQTIHFMNLLNDDTIYHVFNVLDEFRKTSLHGPGFTGPVAELLHIIGLDPDTGNRIDTAMDRAFGNLDNLFDFFKLTPVMWQSAPPPVGDGTPAPCSRGRAQLPETMDVLLNGRRVVLCNPADR